MGAPRPATDSPRMGVSSVLLRKYYSDPLTNLVKVAAMCPAKFGTATLVILASALIVGQNAAAQEATLLQAGDSDRDVDFDQFDLILTLQSAKYLTGQTATWGDGDWNGAPHEQGDPGNPPAGNGMFDQADLDAALGNRLYLTGPYGTGGLTPPELLAPVLSDTNQPTSVVYSPDTGEISIRHVGPRELTSINIRSHAGIFTGAAALNVGSAVGGNFDIDQDDTLFKATFGSSFGSLSFGNVAQLGLSQDYLVLDLLVAGSLAGGGSLGPVAVSIVPEPTSAVLLMLGLLALVTVGQERNRRARRWTGAFTRLTLPTAICGPQQPLSSAFASLGG